MQWRKGMLRLWIVLSVVWCLFLAVQVYLGAAKGARAAVELARTTAEYECASKAADSQEQCVRDRGSIPHRMACVRCIACVQALRPQVREPISL